MSIDFRLTSVTCSDGTTVPIADQGITVLVGPNNSGKSLALREIQQYIQGTPGFARGIMVTGIDGTKTGTAEEFQEWLSRLTVRSVPEDARQAKAPGSQLRFDSAKSEWTTPPTFRLGQLSPFFVHFLNAENRTGLANSVASYDLMND